MQLIIKHDKELDYNYVQKHFKDNKRLFDTMILWFPELSSRLFLESDEEIKDKIVHNYLNSLYENNLDILESKVNELSWKIKELKMADFDKFFDFNLSNFQLNLIVGFLPYNVIDLDDNYLWLYFELFTKQVNYQYLLVFLLTVKLISDKLIINFPNYNLSTYNDISKMLFLSIASSRQDLNEEYKVYYNKKFDHFKIDYEGKEYTVKAFFELLVINYTDFESLIEDKDFFSKILQAFDGKFLIYKYLSKSKKLHWKDILAKDERYTTKLII